MLYEILIIVYLLIALTLIGLILIQQGKGADMGASFGAGSSGTVFGSGGSGNFLTKTTTYLAVGFFVISLVLGNLTTNRVKATDERSNLEAVTENVESAVPAAVEKLSSEDVPAADINNSSDVPQ